MPDVRCIPVYLIVYYFQQMSSFTPPYTPKRVDPTNFGAAESVNQNTNFPSVPFLFNGNYYWMMFDDTNGFFEVLKSTDNQLTWTVIAHDSTDPPINCFLFQTSIVGHVIYMCLENNSTGHVNFIKFDCSTETLSALYGVVGSPSSTVPIGFYVRSTDLHHIVAANAGGSPFAPRFFEFDPVGNTWTGPFALDTNVSNVVTYTVDGIVGTADANGIGHFFFSYHNTDTTIHLFYQQLTALSALGNFQDFGPGQITSGQVNNYNPPVIDNVNGNILLSLLDLTVAPSKWYIIEGIGLNPPVFQLITLIDTVDMFLPPILSIQNNILYATGVSFNKNLIYHWTTAITTPLSGWSVRSIDFDATNTTIVGWQQNNVFFAQIVDIGSSTLFLYFVNLDPTGLHNMEWVLFGSAPIPPSPTNTIRFPGFVTPRPLPWKHCESKCDFQRDFKGVI